MLRNLFKFIKGSKSKLEVSVPKFVSEKPKLKFVKPNIKQKMEVAQIKTVLPPVQINSIVKNSIVAKKGSTYKFVFKKRTSIIKSETAKSVSTLKPQQFISISAKNVTFPPIAFSRDSLIPIIYPYNIDSSSSTLLAEALKTKKVRQNGRYQYRPKHLVINYGNQRPPNWNKNNLQILNHWNRIGTSSNKLEALQLFKDGGVSTVDFTSDKNQAIAWVNDGKTVICRTILNGYSGHGIIVAKTVAEIVNAPLYCLYKPNAGEYRIIVVKGIVVDFMRKKRKLDFEEETGQPVNSLIRNHDNGWIFARNDITVPKDVLEESIKAVAALNLDFAGVDVLFNKRENKAYVLECNTAIGLEPEGTTLTRLSSAFAAICNNQLPQSIV